MRCPTIPETPAVKAVVAGACAYETSAILSGFIPSIPTLPTITALNERWPVIGVAIVGALALHFWTPAPI
ncbi:MAG: hypothetical protein ACXVXW_09825 [Mycobacteriaceae bacterium]